MAIAKRASQNKSDGDWVNIPEGNWRFELGKPGMVYGEKYKKWQAVFPLYLTENEKKRLAATRKTPLQEGQIQSTRVEARLNFSLGFPKDGVYQVSSLVKMISSLFGSENGPRVVSYFRNDGGPIIPDGSSEAAEAELIVEWLSYLEGLEVICKVSHKVGNDKTFANVGDPQAIGVFPASPEPAYDELATKKMLHFFNAGWPEGDGEIPDEMEVEAPAAPVAQSAAPTATPAASVAVQSPAEDEESVLLARLAALKAKQNGSAAPTKTYDELFGKPEAAVAAAV